MRFAPRIEESRSGVHVRGLPGISPAETGFYSITQLVTTLGVTPNAAPDSVAEGSPIRVLWLIKGLGPGGAERLLTLAAWRRDRDRFIVRVAFLMRHKTALVSELEALGVPVTCLARTSPNDPRWLWSLRRSLQTSPVDIVHAHSPPWAAGWSCARCLALGDRE